jgi:hypothetical protein
VFSPRQANLVDLRAAGCPTVVYLPFAYSPDQHWPAPAQSADQGPAPRSDVVFVGGGDADRVPLIAALIGAGLDVALYGSYWDRYRGLRRHARGHADPATLRQVTASARISLCLVRRANRDGHVMRTFEIAAMRGCMLAEETDEHRQLLGAEGEAVVYFNSPRQLVAKARWLLEHPAECQRLAEALYRRVTQGGHTYGDRLAAMLAAERCS